MTSPDQHPPSYDVTGRGLERRAGGPGGFARGAGQRRLITHVWQRRSLGRQKALRAGDYAGAAGGTARNTGAVIAHRPRQRARPAAQPRGIIVVITPQTHSGERAQGIAELLCGRRASFQS